MFFCYLFALLLFFWMFVNSCHFAMSSRKTHFVWFFFRAFVLRAIHMRWYDFFATSTLLISRFFSESEIWNYFVFVSRGFCSLGRTRICNSNWAKYSPNIRSRFCNETQKNTYLQTMKLMQSDFFSFFTGFSHINDGICSVFSLSHFKQSVKILFRVATR